MEEQTSTHPEPAEPTPDLLRAGHEESLDRAHDLVEAVDQAEAAQGDPVPSQAHADETAATGI